RGARTPSSASRCRRGSGALVLRHDVRTRRPHPTSSSSRANASCLTWGADALVREPLPSRQRCPCTSSRRADETSAPHLTLPSRQRCPCASSRRADETSAPHLIVIPSERELPDVGRGRPRPRAAAVEAAVPLYFVTTCGRDVRTPPHRRHPVRSRG